MKKSTKITLGTALLSFVVLLCAACLGAGTPVASKKPKSDVQIKLIEITDKDSITYMYQTSFKDEEDEDEPDGAPTPIVVPINATAAGKDLAIKVVASPSDSNYVIKVNGLPIPKGATQAPVAGGTAVIVVEVSAMIDESKKTIMYQFQLQTEPAAVGIFNASGELIYDPGSADNVLQKSLDWLRTYDEIQPGEYTIRLANDEVFDDRQVNSDTLNNTEGVIINIECAGADKPVKLSIPSNGGSAMFYVRDGATVAFGAGITIDANSRNFVGTIQVLERGTVILNGAKITGGMKSSAVAMNGGTFIMKSGEISGNTGDSDNISAIYLRDDARAIVEIEGGSISNNIFPKSKGGGIYIGKDSELTMRGGTISGNQALWGGGIYLNEMSVYSFVAGSISGNTLVSGGGQGPNIYKHAGATVSPPSITTN